MARELAILVTARNMASGVFKDVRGDIKGIQSEARRGLSSTARNLGLLGVAAGGALATQVHAGVQSLARLETIAAQTNAAITSTGAAANVTAKEVRDQADAIERLTGIESESIQEGQNLLLTFTGIRNEVGKDNDMFNQATEALVDMSQALGQDASQSAIQLGKALNDPIRGVTALRRVGVQLTAEQEKSIKTFMEQGDIMSAQKIILAELNREFGGSASAFGQTAQANLQKMQHAWGALQEQLALGVLPVLTDLTQKFTEMFNDPKAAQIAQDIGKGLGEGLEAAIDIATKLPWEAIGTTFSLMGQGAKAALQMFTSMPPWVQTAVLTGWGLNALSGGSLGRIVGMLGAGLVKGVLGMNAGVVNAKAGVVNVAGAVPGAGAGPAAAAGRGGGMLGMLGTVTIAGAGLAALTTIATEISKDTNPTGFSFNELAGQTGTSRVQVEGDLLTLSAETGRSVTNLQAEMIPLLQEGNLTWDQVVDAVESGGDKTAAAADRAAAAARDALPWAQRNVAEVNRLNASEASRFGSTIGTLRTIANKRTTFNPHVNVTANINNTVRLSTGAVLQSVNNYRQTLNAGTSVEGFI